MARETEPLEVGSHLALAGSVGSRQPDDEPMSIWGRRGNDGYFFSRESPESRELPELALAVSPTG